MARDPKAGNPHEAGDIFNVSSQFKYILLQISEMRLDELSMGGEVDVEVYRSTFFSELSSAVRIMYTEKSTGNCWLQVYFRGTNSNPNLVSRPASGPFG